MSAYKLDGYINARVSPWAVLQAEILPLLPVSVSWGAGGLSMRSIVLDQRPDAAIYAIEVGRNAERVTPIRYSPSSAVVNRLTIEYAPNAATGAYTQSVTVTSSADPDIATDPTLRPSPWATASQAVFGVRAQTVQTSWVYDSATAEAMALSLVRRMHAPSMLVAYRGGGELGGARPGDLVRVTDSGTSWLDVAALVESVSIDEGDSIVLGLRRYPALGNR